MLTFFYEGVFTNLKYQNTMLCFENTGPATREVLKDFFASYT